MNLEDIDSNVTHIAKVVLVGDASVGKTSLLNRLVNQQFKKNQERSRGVEFFTKSFLAGCGRSYKLQFWDVPGDLQFTTAQRLHYVGVAIVIVVFSMCNQESFNHLEHWLGEVNSQDDFSLDVEPMVCLIATKSDLSHMRVVSEDDARLFAKRHGDLLYFEMSSLSSEGVEQGFHAILDAFDLHDEALRSAGGDGLTRIMDFPASLEEEDAAAEDEAMWLDSGIKRIRGRHRRRLLFCCIPK